MERRILTRIAVVLLLVALGMPVWAQHFLVKKSVKVIQVDSPPTLEGDYVCFDLGTSRKCVHIDEVDLNKTRIVRMKESEGGKSSQGKPKVLSNEDLEARDVTDRYAELESKRRQETVEQEAELWKDVDNTLEESESLLDDILGSEEEAISDEELTEEDYGALWAGLSSGGKVLFVVFFVLFFALYTAVVGLVLALFLRLAGHIVLRDGIPFGRVYLTSCGLLILNSAISGVLGVMVGPRLWESGVGVAVPLGGWVLFGAIIYNSFIHSPRFPSVSFGRALLLAFLQFLFFMMLVAVIVLSVIGVLFLLG